MNHNSTASQFPSRLSWLDVACVPLCRTFRSNLFQFNQTASLIISFIIYLFILCMVHSFNWCCPCLTYFSNCQNNCRNRAVLLPFYRIRRFSRSRWRWTRCLRRRVQCPWARATEGRPSRLPRCPLCSRRASHFYGTRRRRLRLSTHLSSSLVMFVLFDEWLLHPVYFTAVFPGLGRSLSDAQFDTGHI